MWRACLENCEGERTFIALPTKCHEVMIPVVPRINMRDIIEKDLDDLVRDFRCSAVTFVMVNECVIAPDGELATVYRQK